MRLHLASLARTGKHQAAGLGRAPSNDARIPSTVRAGVHVDAASLAKLESAARDFGLLPRQPVHSLLSGRHASKVRGRGLAFEELRPYLFGDDIRNMDWRVTARTGVPHVRVYTEEKDRPVLLLVDQRMNMFFGTRRAMKSVAAAEVAALVAWRMLADGDRIGALVFGDEEMTELRPQRSRDAVLHLLGEVARHNQALHAQASPVRGSGQLNQALLHAAHLAHHDHLVVVVSDFEGRDDRTRDLLLQLSAHNDLLAVLVHDPFLSELPPSGDLVVSNGELQVELGLGRDPIRRGIAEFVDDQKRELFAWQHGIGVPVLPVSAAEDSAAQLRHLLGRLTPAAQRGRR
jgi:uncharacterized protein (DUF58 family)